MELLVIGLDGLSYNMLERFDVEFPYLDRLRQSGLSGDLMSVDTPTTVPAWTSFATGKDPGSHGIHGMKRISRDYVHGSAQVNKTDPAIYDFLDDSIFLNLPSSSGRVPSGKDTYVQSSILSVDKDSMTPAPLRELDSYDAYVPMHDPSLKSRPNAYLDHVIEIARSREQFAREAFETFDPRVGFVLFSTPDWAGHILSKLTSDEARQRFYRQLLGEIAEATENLASLCDNVVVMSDHGFEYKHRTVHLADWLHDEGYMELDRSAGSGQSPRDRLVNAVANGAVGAAKALSRRSDALYASFRFLHNRLLGTDVGDLLQDAARPTVDYPNSTVFHLRYGCLYLNDERFAAPKVRGEEADRLRDQLVEDLADLETKSGDPVFREVLTADEAYADPIDDVPDVIPRPAPGHFPITHWSPTGGYTSPTSNYEHRYRGIIAAEGPMFTGGTVEDMSIVDILPTVLAALGDPLSPDFDGQARTDLLADPTPVTTMDREDLPSARVASETDEDRSEREDVVHDRLADLGYMD